MTSPVYEIRWTETALKLLEAVADARIRRAVWARAGRLERDPDKQGKALTGELKGFRSVRAVGQRFRIIYAVDGQQVIIYIAAAGIRRAGDGKDIYELAKKLLKHGIVR